MFHGLPAVWPPVEKAEICERELRAEIQSMTRERELRAEIQSMTREQIMAKEAQEPGWIETEVNLRTLIDYRRNEIREAEEICMSRLPKPAFEINQGISFADFLISFKASIESEMDILDNKAIHRLLYFKCGPFARKLLGAANVPKRHSEKTPQEYYDIVQKVFELANPGRNIPVSKET